MVRFALPQPCLEYPLNTIGLDPRIYIDMVVRVAGRTLVFISLLNFSTE